MSGTPEPGVPGQKGSGRASQSLKYHLLESPRISQKFIIVDEARKED